MRVLLLAAVVMAAAFVPLASAQDVTADSSTLYFFRDEGAGEYVLSADPDAPYTQGTWGGQLPYGGPAGRSFSFSLVDAAPVTIDLDGDIEITAVYGSEGAGIGSIAWSLTSGSTEIGSGSWDVQWASGYQTHTATIPYTGSLDLAQGLVFDVDSETAYASVAARMDLAASSIVLPVQGGEVGPTVMTYAEELESPAVSHAFSNATSDTYVLNFTNDLENVTASFAWNATNGSVQVQLSDSDGTLFEGVFEGAGSQEEIFEGVAAGAWNLTVTYSNFTGSFDFGLGPVEVGADGVSGGDGSDGADGADAPDGMDGGDGNATGNETLDGADDQESPGLPVVLGLTTVALVAVLRRRE